MTISAEPDADAPATGEPLVLADFTPAHPGPDWYVVNDNVMGGRSDGGFDIADGRLSFSGRTNTDGGGFSSIRSEPMALDLSGQAGIRLRVRADGRRYTWRLTTSAQWRGRDIAYWAGFDTADGQWTTVDIPFARFVPQFRGQRLDGPALDSGDVTGMGLMIYDGRDGAFELLLDSIAAYPAVPLFSLEQQQWKRRVLVVSAADETDAQLRDLLNELAATRDEFTDRDLLLVTLLDSGASTAGDRVLTSDDVTAARKALGIRPATFAVRLVGKDGGVKLSSEHPVSMADVYALIDTMPMRQREKADDQGRTD